MSMQRRDFLTVVGSGLLLHNAAALAASNAPTNIVTLLHTNDTHSRIDPYPSGRKKGMGGVAKRSTLIQQLKAKQPHTLVVDAGDVFQGTPYFNLFKGRLELEVMSKMGYDLATIGNHDFDLGANWFLTSAQKYANFPFVSANLHFSQAHAGRVVKPYTIKQVGGRKLGFFGLGIQFQGLVPKKLHKGVTYSDPIRAAEKTVRILRHQHKCDVVILLSHLGYTGSKGEPGDVDLPGKVGGIDVIIGGHTHTFLQTPTVKVSKHGKQTKIYQVGHSGICLGQIDLLFDKKGFKGTLEQVHLVK